MIPNNAFVALYLGDELKRWRLAVSAISIPFVYGQICIFIGCDADEIIQAVGIVDKVDAPRITAVIGVDAFDLGN